jgi:hypothetical protein
MYREGLVVGYAEVGSEYPPISLAILYASRTLGDMVGLSPPMSIKIAILTFQLMATGLILLLSGSYWIAAAFNGSILLSAVGLGYMDACFAAPLIAAFWAFRARRDVLGTALFLLACLVKWQPLIVAPFIAIYLFRISNLRSLGGAFRTTLFLQLAVLVAAVFALLSLIFGLAPVRSLWHGINHPILSGTALNLPWIAGFLHELVFAPGFSIQAEARVLSLPAVYLLPFKAAFAVAFGAVVMRAIQAEKTLENCLLFSIVGLVTYATWNTNVHENHLFVAVVLGHLLVVHQGTPQNRAIAAVLAVMFNINLFVFYGVTGTQLQSPVVGGDLTIALAALYVIAWVLLAAYAWRTAQR